MNTEITIKPEQKQHIFTTTEPQLVKNTSFYLKIGFLSLLLFIESFIFAITADNFVKSHKLFSVTAEFSVRTIILMSIVLITLALTVGAWKEWEKYIFIPIPVALAFTIATYTVFPRYALYVGLIGGLLLTYDVYLSSRIKNLLIKFDPRFALRFTTRGLMFIFSTLAGSLVILNAANVDQINVGHKIAEITEEPVKAAVEDQLKKQAENNLMPLFNDPMLSQNLKSLGIDEIYETNNKNITDLNVGPMIETKINQFLQPYKNFFHPIMAVLTFFVFQFYASVAYFIYSIVIDPIFSLAKKTGFIKAGKVKVEQEQLYF